METFYFFNVTDPATFKTKLANQFHPLVTSATKLLDPTTQPLVAVNIGFSAKGLKAIGVNDDLGDPNFHSGQAVDAAGLGDPGTVKWREAYRKGIHGIIQVAGKEMGKIDGEWDKIKALFGDSIQEVHKLHAHARPGANMGHERKKLTVDIAGFCNDTKTNFQTLAGWTELLSLPSKDGIPQVPPSLDR